MIDDNRCGISNPINRLCVCVIRLDSIEQYIFGKACNDELQNTSAENSILIYFSVEQVKLIVFHVILK